MDAARRCRGRTRSWPASRKAKEAWLPVDARQRVLAVEKQEKLAESMLHTTRKLIALRKASAALSRGAFRVVEAEDGLLVFDRVVERRAVRCVFNSGDGDARRRSSDAGVAVVGRCRVRGRQLVLEPYSAAILKLAERGGRWCAVKTVMESWMFWALLSAMFAAMTAILGQGGRERASIPTLRR